jgi:hypothetical protein
MRKTQAWPDPLILRLDEYTLRGLARSRSRDGELRVFVPYTCPHLTRAALIESAALARNLGAHITLFAVQIVPFPLPLERPDVLPKFLERKLMAIAREIESPADVRIVFARDLDSGAQQVLMPGSLVVVATEKRWWPTAEMKLARSLARAGHGVALLGI